MSDQLPPEVKAQIVSMEASLGEAEKFFKPIAEQLEYDDFTVDVSLTH